MAEAIVGGVLGLAKGILSMADDIKESKERTQFLFNTITSIVATVSIINSSSDNIVKPLNLLKGQLKDAEVVLKKVKKKGKIGRFFGGRRIISDLQNVNKDLLQTFNILKSTIEMSKNVGPAKHIANKEASTFWFDSFGDDKEVSHARAVYAIRKKFGIEVSDAFNKIIKLIDYDDDGKIAYFEFDTFFVPKKNMKSIILENVKGLESDEEEDEESKVEPKEQEAKESAQENSNNNGKKPASVKLIKAYEQKWGKGWIKTDYYSVGDKTFMIFYKADGTLSICSAIPNSSKQVAIKEVGSHKVDKDLSILTCVQSTGDPTPILTTVTLKGNVKWYKLDDKGSLIWIKEATWGEGWTHYEWVNFNGKSYGHFQKVEGTYNICEISSKTGTTTLQNKKWSAGWDTFAFFEYKSKLNQCIFKSSTGSFEIGNLKKDLSYETGCKQSWQTRNGWNQFDTFTINGTPMMAYLATKTGKFGFATITDDSCDEIMYGRWNPGWRSLMTLNIGNDAYMFAQTDEGSAWLGYIKPLFDC